MGNFLSNYRINEVKKLTDVLNYFCKKVYLRTSSLDLEYLSGNMEECADMILYSIETGIFESVMVICYENFDRNELYFDKNTLFLD
jgi:hypothetical protein